MVTFRSASATHPGLVREHNEDSYLVGTRLAVIADGVGGHAAGEVASELAVKSFRELSVAELPLDEPARRLREAVAKANESIAQDTASNSEHEGMGTTLTALLFGDKNVTVAHVGDSRAYRLREGELRQLTRDDSYVQMLIDKGALEPADARTHPYRSVVTKVLLGTPVDASVSRLDTVDGDRYLVCSDGLSDVVPDADIKELLGDSVDPERTCEALVEATLKGGAPDNVTVVVVHVSMS